MADVQPENGFTRIANPILENIIKLSLNGTQFRIIMLVWRETYGFNRKEHSLSETFIASRLGLQRQNIHREITGLFDSKILIAIHEATFNSSRVIAFNKNYDEWRNGLQESKQTTGIGLDSSTGIENDSSTGIGLDSHRKKQLMTLLKTTPIAPKGATDSSNYDTRFLEFWESYPRKTGKGAAEHAFKKYKPDDTLLALMLKAIEVQKRSDQWIKDSGQYIPNPSTWLNQRRWEDETPDNPVKGKELPYL